MSSCQIGFQINFSNKDLDEYIKHGKLIYIYGNGVAGRWAWKTLESLGVQVYAFIDSDMKKQIFNYGFNTISVAEAERTLNSDDLIVIAAVDIHEILIIKNQTRLQSVPWVSLGKLAGCLMGSQGVDPPSDFEKYSIDVILSCHDRLLDKNDLFLRSVDIIITEKCSLRCRDCANLMQYYKKPRNFGLDEIITAVDWLVDTVDAVFEFRLIGGEPFMNNNIYDIIERLLQYNNYNKLVIYTNGTIPIKDKYKDLFSHEKIIFSITDYGDIAKNTSKFIQQVSDMGVVYRVHPPEHWTDSGRIKKNKRQDLENQKIFDNCCGKNLWTLSSQGFGRCPFALNAAHLGAIRFSDNSVVQIGDSKKLKKYLINEKFIDVCDLCNGRSFSSPEIIPAIQSPKPLDMEL